MRLRALTILFLSLILLIASVSADISKTFDPADTVIVNRTYEITNATGLPMNIWLASIILGIILILLSFWTFPHGEEGIVAVMAIFPVGLALASAFNVDQITVAGITALTGSYTIIEKHSLYHFDLIAYTCLLPLLVFTFINVARIWINMKAVKQIARVEPEEQE